MPDLPLPKPLLLPAIALPSLVLLSSSDTHSLGVIAFSTGGIAVPVLFPNFAGYLVVAMFLVLLAQVVVGRRRGILFAVGIAGVLALAIGVPFASIVSARQAAAELARHDRLEVGQSRPATIEFMFPTSGGAQADPLRNAPCEEVCQRLLLGREVDWVRVTGVNKHTNEPPAHGASVVYRLQAGSSCLEAIIDTEPPSPGPPQVRPPGVCTVPIQGSAELRWPAEARASVRVSADGGSAFKRHHKPDPSFLRQTRVEATHVEPGRGPRTVATHTEVVTNPLSPPLRRAGTGPGPLLYKAASYVHLRVYFEVARSKAVFQPIDMADLLRRAFGYRVAAPAGSS